MTSLRKTASVRPATIAAATHGYAAALRARRAANDNRPAPGRRRNLALVAGAWLAGLVAAAIALWRTGGF
ncbi:hypothetical protein NS228_26950 [Methylobacterium indicum]|uniref:Uncharacterized protein n=1 Tax=Methylobacterium indicum TaxID=1775910 RepID=A0A0J6RBC8_9HYPH|nr:hypothetical protein [Methylobacterium indicum]KMO18649.1 hypothetical protein QR79_19900 [Methylobacterium indicum]KMO21645.1 hypothetical protein QR78_08270 [Methylobacterium indicum]KTS23849.1 hypothetical protein NS228_26950 [Methylobacterium indicum]KTS37638.1 hypothetical protein NS229_06370 [Methylobacterium indicum]KTS46776.1 hypothetical protein NS230_21830 [Methylobacterium indicum]